MDISETYIEMCAKAQEVQSLRPPQNLFFEGDYFASKGYKGKWYITLATPNGKNRGRSVYFKAVKDGLTDVWLPRQDQLQAMTRSDWFDLISDIYYFSTEELPLDDGRAKAMPVAYCDSMEQLWLAFVMKEHNKVWDGEDWK